MRVRSRAQGAQGAETPDFSTPKPVMELAPSSAVNTEAATGVRKRRSPVHPTPYYAEDVINAFWQRSELVVISPDSAAYNGIRFRRLPAEHSCFVKLADLKDPMSMHRMLNSHRSVRKALIEDDWLRICWADRDVLKEYCKSFHEKGIKTYEGAVSPVLRFMVDGHLKSTHPRPLWIDIETDNRPGFSRKEEMRILCWTGMDDQGVEYESLLEEDTEEDERRVLLELWNVLDSYDQIIAWNGDRFDFPVIKARSERHNLLRTTDREVRRWLWLDQLELFKRMNMSVSESGEEKQSFKLGVVAESVLGPGQSKLDFDASKTWQEWEAGGERRQRLLKYCAQDTRLMPAIEKKTGYILLLQTVADTCGTFCDSRGVNPGVQVEGFLARLAHERGYKFPTVLKLGVDTTNKYEGAYVLHPQEKAGIHHDVHVADFAALYPSIIRTWNMSPETIVQVPDEELPAGLLQKTALSPMTAKRFRTDIPGILPEAVKQLMDLRSKWNKLKASLPPGTDEWKDADRRAGAYKITQNSFYGVIGSPASRFYDRNVAESVTQCGKWLIIETIKAAESQGMKVIYGDTDSLFVVGSTRWEFEAFIKWCNATLYPELLHRVGCTENIINLAYEKQFARLIISVAKKYCGSYVHYKGQDANSDSHPEIKGLEYKRGDALKMARDMQEEIVNLLIGYKQPFSDEPSDYEAIIMRWQQRVLEHRLELADVMISKRMNKPLDAYKAEPPMVRIARILGERGEDVGEGAKIDYVVVDAEKSPQVVIPASDFDADTTPLDREALWDKLIWPPTERLIQAAFPGHKWESFGHLARTRRRATKEAARVLAKQQKDFEKAQTASAKVERKQAKAQPVEAPPPVLVRRTRKVEVEALPPPVTIRRRVRKAEVEPPEFDSPITMVRRRKRVS